MKIQEIAPCALKAGKAAEYLGISRRYLHDLTQQGRLPYHKIGTRCHVYQISDLNKFLTECRVGSGVGND